MTAMSAARMLRTTSWVRWAMVTAVTLSVAPSRGAAQEERAQLHFRAGASYYEAGDYEDALREFQRSYALSKRPELYYNFSLCHQQLGNYDQAVADLDKFLTEVDAIENRENLERRLENLRRRAAVPSAEPTDEDEADGETASAPAEGNQIPWGAVAGYGVAGAGVVLLSVAGAMALSEKSALQNDPCSSTQSCDASTLRRRAILADVGLGVAVLGAALGTTFLVLGIVSPRKARSEARLQWSPVVSHQVTGAVLEGEF